MTPIIDAAADLLRNKSTWNAQAKDLTFFVLRSVLPWDLPAERLEAMAIAAYRVASCTPKYGDWFSQFDEAEKNEWRRAALATYRADPIMRELYPEKF